MGFFDWWIFQPPPLTHPEDFPGYEPNQPIEHLPITTRRGRVVYNRKPHKFTEKDLLRVAGQVYSAPKDQRHAIWWITVLERITIMMMDRIFEFILRREVDGDFVSRLYYLLRNQLALVIDKLLGEQLTAALDDLWGLSGGDRAPPVSGGGH